MISFINSLFLFWLSSPAKSGSHNIAESENKHRQHDPHIQWYFTPFLNVWSSSLIHRSKFPLFIFRCRIIKTDSSCIGPMYLKMFVGWLWQNCTEIDKYLKSVFCLTLLKKIIGLTINNYLCWILFLVYIVIFCRIVVTQTLILYILGSSIRLTENGQWHFALIVWIYTYSFCSINIFRVFSQFFVSYH